MYRDRRNAQKKTLRTIETLAEMLGKYQHIPELALQVKLDLDYQRNEARRMLIPNKRITEAIRRGTQRAHETYTERRPV